MRRREALEKAHPGAAAPWTEPWGAGARFAFGAGEGGKFLAIRFPNGDEMTCHWDEQRGMAEYRDCPLDPPDVGRWEPYSARGGTAGPPAPRQAPEKPLSPYED